MDNPCLYLSEICYRTQSMTGIPVQWNLSNPVTQGPGALGLNREVAVLHMTL